MKVLDTDQDDELSPTEIENAVAALKTLDRDGDGTLSHDEIRPRFRGPHPRRPAGPPAGRRGQPDGGGQQRGKRNLRPPGPAQQ
ncbi:MAG: hypothetical protein OES79_08480 [Planctomycetota bacterium]|nr:hypothetical protein [Planctomycetota bacterium]